VVTLQSDQPILLVDGSCGFCARSVQFLLRHEGSRHDLLFAPLAGPTGRGIRTAHPELDGVDSMVWYEASRPLVRSVAAIRAARYLGGGWGLLGGLAWLVPRPIRDWAYRQVARHRHRVTGPCVIPTAEQRARFLDVEDW
jgi:predicted DCC family thiol-disulfide oxidoreductase YuxK